MRETQCDDRGREREDGGGRRTRWTEGRTSVVEIKGEQVNCIVDERKEASDRNKINVN